MPNPSSELLLRLTRERPDVFGWNEYTEGGYIAPTRLNGDGHLKAVEKVFGRN